MLSSKDKRMMIEKNSVYLQIRILMWSMLKISKLMSKTKLRNKKMKFMNIIHFYVIMRMITFLNVIIFLSTKWKRITRWNCKEYISVSVSKMRMGARLASLNKIVSINKPNISLKEEGKFKPQLLNMEISTKFWNTICLTMREKTSYKMQNDMTFAWRCLLVKASYIRTLEFTPMKSLLFVQSKTVEWALIKKETFSSTTVECMQKHSKMMISELLSRIKMLIK